MSPSLLLPALAVLIAVSALTLSLRTVGRELHQLRHALRRTARLRLRPMTSVEAPLPCEPARRNERTMLACGSPAVLSGGTSPPASLGSIRPMGNLGGGEMLVIFFVALIVLGPNKLPDAARQVGRAVNEIRRVSGGFQREMREAMNEPMRPRRRLGTR